MIVTVNLLPWGVLKVPIEMPSAPFNLAFDFNVQVAAKRCIIKVLEHELATAGYPDNLDPTRPKQGA